jgi:hypothetical protein
MRVSRKRVAMEIRLFGSRFTLERDGPYEQQIKTPRVMIVVIPYVFSG